MGLDSPFFLFFFCAIFVLYHFGARSNRAKQMVLAAASLFYCASWGWLPAAVLLCTGLSSYCLAGWIFASPDEKTGSRRTAAAICVNTVPLAGFMIHKALWGKEDPSILLPVGLSFYGLQCVSYSLDVRRGILTPCRDPVSYFAALAFFPRLLAGPFIRWSEWLPQFSSLSPLTENAARRGLLLCSWGIAKIAAAEFLAPAANTLFIVQREYSRLEAWSGLLAFTGQLYGSFSGTIDIAAGTALLMGFSFPPNFNLPFSAATPIEFWRRWHISLYSWLYDYLYLPLALTLRKNLSIALLLTVLAAGLWHGLTPNFALYGLYHALLLILSHRLLPRSGIPPQLRFIFMTATFVAVLAGLAIFRSESPSQALALWSALFSPSAPEGGNLKALLVPGAFLAAIHALDSWTASLDPKSLQGLKGGLLIFFGFLICFILGRSPAGFIYAP